jgi:hypothetical protein
MGRKHRRGTFREFKKFTLDVVKGKRRLDPGEPKIWVESADQVAARQKPGAAAPDRRTPSEIRK